MKQECNDFKCTPYALHSFISDLTDGHYVWIGLTDVDEEEVFDSWTDGTAVTYTNFHCESFFFNQYTALNSFCCCELCHCHDRLDLLKFEDVDDQTGGYCHGSYYYINW